MLACLPEQVGPHDGAAGGPAAPAPGLQPFEAQEPDVVGRHPESAERLQGLIGGIGVDVGGHERVARPVACVGPRDVLGAGQRGDALCDALHHRGGTEDAQMQHRLATLAPVVTRHLTRSG